MHPDTARARGLAHPLRVRLLGALQEAGRGTATSLAAALGESTGATSYHLRQLARHGLVAEDAAPGRARWWRSTASEPGWEGAVEATLRLTPDQADRLGAELADLVDRYRLLSHSDEGGPVRVRYAVVRTAAPVALG